MKMKLLKWLVRDMVRSSRWTDVLEIYWEEHRRCYTEENLPTAKAAISEVIEELANKELVKWEGPR